MSGCYRVGQVKFGESEYKIGLIDINNNGTFSDKARDNIRIDVNRDGKIASSLEGVEVYPASKYVVVGGECYSFNISPDGSSLQVTPPDVECGILKSSSEYFSLLMRGKYGMMRVEGKNYRAKIPVGSYRIRSCVFAKKDAEGNLWEIVGDLNGRRVKITSDTPTSFAFGPPLTVSLSTSKRGNRVVNFNLKIKGKGGEVYSPQKLTKNGREVPAPSVKILSESGRSFGEHRFQYG